MFYNIKGFNSYLVCFQNRIILVKFIYGQSLIWSRNSLTFMELVGLWSRLQETATGPYPELAESSPHPETYFIKNDYDVISSSMHASQVLFSFQIL